MKVGCIQPELNQDRKSCYKTIEKLIVRFYKVHNNCDLLMLPERWVPFSNRVSDNFQKERGADYRFVRNLAKEYSVNFLTGGIWEKRPDDEKPRITCYYFNSQGEEMGRQDKLHLYTYEKEVFEAGNELYLFKLNNRRFVILICFDLAFYETPRIAVENGAEILFSPTQIREDGMENWYTYLKARALENRIPVVGCNTFGFVLKRKFIGGSKIISFVEGFTTPSKLKIKNAPLNKSGFVFDDINLNFAKELRKIRLKEKIPMKEIRIVKV